MLQVTNVSEFRKNIKKYIDGVVESNNKVIINSNGKSVVMISLDEYNAIDETDYLLGNEANKERLYKAKEQIETGLSVPVDLDNNLKFLEHD